MTQSGFRVFIPDPTHGEGGWPEGEIDRPAAGPSAEFRKSLEAEYETIARIQKQFSIPADQTIVETDFHGDAAEPTGRTCASKR